MSEWIAAYWPMLALGLVVAVMVWLGRLRQREIERLSRVCPTCHGFGRIDRDLTS